MQCQVLKSVVQQQVVQWKAVQNPFSQTISIRANRHNDTRTADSDQVWFVPRIRWSGQNLNAIRHEEVLVSTGASVASAENTDALPIRVQPSGQCDDDRSFTGSTYSEISDTHDTAGQTPA